ncbi:hypothetical protein [Chamaesiphon sp. OTE_8_metabat_110]|uniref:hypothetical protein n=1 Tax=Chamaesiphon sp. OTE_8_metabat_110 TaxID=2964696 RepID=UPI00286B94A6|nr:MULTISPECIES: hypothetical protein [unclassified Chamaesiphon]
MGNVPADRHQAPFPIAIASANPHFYPQVVAAFAYGAHTAAIGQLGYAPRRILPISDALPILLIGGTCDGVDAIGLFIRLRSN